MMNINPHLFAENFIAESIAQQHARARGTEIGVVDVTPGVGAFLRHLAHHDHTLFGLASQMVSNHIHGFFAELALFIQPGGQLNLFAQALKNTDFAVVDLGQDHMETVRAEVDGGDQGERFGRGVWHAAALVEKPRHPATKRGAGQCDKLYLIGKTLRADSETQ